MSCEICGNDLHGYGIKVKVEGALLTVCKNCAEFGERVHEERRENNILRNAHERPKKPKPATPGKPVPKPVARTQTPRKKAIIEENEDLVGNFADIIKKARGDIKLEDFAASLNEKVSVIQKIEAGKLKPTTKLAKRIEKRYRVKLLENRDEAEDVEDVVWKSDKKQNDYSPTLGDYVKKKD